MTNNTGPSTPGTPAISVSPSPASPTTVNPALALSCSTRFRFVAFATGIRASAPADDFQATAVTDALRRSGMITPCAPKAAAERTIAPRL